MGKKIESADLRQRIMQEISYYAHADIQDIYAKLKSSVHDGLAQDYATQLLQKYGKNELSGHDSTWWQILGDQIQSPFIYLLVIIACVHFSLGDIPDGIMLLVLVVINSALSFYQEFKTHYALALLKQYSIEKTYVIRDGKKIEIPANQLVPGDRVILSAGDKIPADMRLIEVENCTIDESVLTGESTPVQKGSAALSAAPLDTMAITIFNASNIAFSGTFVASGAAQGIVFATGNSTYFGSIITQAKEAPKLSSFMQGITRFSKFILYLVCITIVCVFVLHVMLSSKKIDLIHLITFTLALGISIIPEALPIVITFSIARGALRLAQHKVITKRLSSIEDLGSMQILCVDKTGTLTENVVTLREIKGADERKVIFYATLASGLTPQELEHDTGFNGPLWQRLTDQEKKRMSEFRVIARHPFEPQLRYSSVIVRKSDACELIIRGNVQEVLPRCSITQQEVRDISQWAAHEAENARLVHIIAKKGVAARVVAITSELEQDFEVVGLVSYEDPIKPTVSDSLTKAQELGVAVKIMSGDAKAVNVAIAQKIKLIGSEQEAISGEEFAQQSAVEKMQSAKKYSVFAHIDPDQKVEIVQLLEESSDIGYLGDGINDAPALKIAHVSMAVNTAADATRDVADIILLHKSLHVIVDGIHEGRIIFANIIKYIKSTLTPNFGHFYALSIAALLIDFLPMLPAQLLLVSLLTDLPLIAIATDTVTFADINRPRKYDLKEISIMTMLLGIIVMIADFVIFRLFYAVSPAVLQTNWFITSMLVELSFFYSIRTTGPFYKAPRPSLTVMLLSAILAAVAVGLPFTQLGQKLLHFHSPAAHHLGVIALVVVCYFILTDMVKVLYYRLNFQPISKATK